MVLNHGHALKSHTEFKELCIHILNSLEQSYDSHQSSDGARMWTEDVDHLVSKLTISADFHPWQKTTSSKRCLEKEKQEHNMLYKLIIEK